jgi:hypothetical protein
MSAVPAASTELLTERQDLAATAGCRSHKNRKLYKKHIIFSTFHARFRKVKLLLSNRKFQINSGTIYAAQGPAGEFSSESHVFYVNFFSQPKIPLSAITSPKNLTKRHCPIFKAGRGHIWIRD